MARKARRAIKQKQKQTVIVNIGALTRPRRRQGLRPLQRPGGPGAAARPPVVVRQAPGGPLQRPGGPLINAGFADHYARVNAMALDDFRRGIAAAARETPAQHEAEERELARGGQLSRLVAEADDLRVQNAAVEARASGLESEILSQKATLEDHYRGMLDDQRRRHVRAIEESRRVERSDVSEEELEIPMAVVSSARDLRAGVQRQTFNETMALLINGSMSASELPITKLKMIARGNGIIVPRTMSQQDITAALQQVIARKR